MIPFVSEKILIYWCKKEVIDTSQKELYQYGIELLLSTVVGIVSVITLGIIYEAVAQAMVFLLLFILLRMYTGGYHADTYFRCNLTMITLFTMLFLLVKHIEFTFTHYAVGYSIGFITILWLAPIEHVNKKLEKNEKRKYKMIAIILYGLLFAVFLLLNLFSYYKKIQYSIFVTLMEIILLMYLGKRKGGRIHEDESNF